MAKQIETQVKKLTAELAAVKKELKALKDATKTTKKVSTSVDGPRRSEVFVDAQVIPMTGEFKRSGEREVELEPTTVDVDIALKGLVGTATTFAIEINGKKKTEKFVTAQEKELKSFTYPFSDFGL
jgi:hypothetical protein